LLGRKLLTDNRLVPRKATKFKRFSLMLLHGICYDRRANSLGWVHRMGAVKEISPEPRKRKVFHAMLVYRTLVDDSYNE
jgi:hypothetical protein